MSEFNVLKLIFEKDRLRQVGGLVTYNISNHLRSTYDCIVRGVAGAHQYFDLKTVRNLALRCPQSKSDALFIRKSMEDGELFHGFTDPASRRQILNNILSINIIIPSLKTFHENMKYFAIGAKILRQHILSEDDAKGQPRSFAQRLQWSKKDEMRGQQQLSGLCAKHASGSNELTVQFGGLAGSSCRKYYRLLKLKYLCFVP
ncbi:hypothetical protein CC80DRAFT_545738 [Byssothecium circinans]|uniref:Uncharacterized protein n=1 Tax=Byssothecium circinans TaxID=147558 RepID=A0A6A5U933_9PLEO|nr:hypothetical protein CC80DRAFT_545738 [Byssothecium circinans]